MPAFIDTLLTAVLARVNAAWAWVCRDSHKQKARALCADVQRLFTRHPHETGETYLQHLSFTLKMAGRILLCGLLLPVHGVFPFLFTRTTSRWMQRIYAILQARKARGDGMDPGI